MSLERAAHVRHGIAHSSELGENVGMFAGFLLGVAGVLLAPFSAGTSLTLSVGGFGSLLGGIVGGALDKRKVIDGRIADGARTVYYSPAVERAAHAHEQCKVDCHGGAHVVQGSRTVFVELAYASRFGDGTSCAGRIAEGDPRIFIGGPRATNVGQGDPSEPRSLLNRLLSLLSIVGSASAVFKGATLLERGEGLLGVIVGIAEAIGDSTGVGDILTVLGIRGLKGAKRSGARR